MRQESKIASIFTIACASPRNSSFLQRRVFPPWFVGWRKGAGLLSPEFAVQIFQSAFWPRWRFVAVDERIGKRIYLYSPIFINLPVRFLQKAIGTFLDSQSENRTFPLSVLLLNVRLKPLFFVTSIPEMLRFVSTAPPCGGFSLVLI